MYMMYVYVCIHCTICWFILLYIYILLYCSHLNYIALYIVLMYVVLYYLIVCIVIILENLGRMMNLVFLAPDFRRTDGKDGIQ